VRPYQWPPFSIVFCNFLTEISEIMGPAMKSKAYAKTGFANRRIANWRRCMEPINVN
jgi:hypothetical protein